MNIHEISDAFHAGIEVGRNSIKHEMAELAKITAAFAESGVVSIIGSAHGADHVKQGRAAKATTAPLNVAVKEPKAPKISRGVRASAGPRAKGVKEAIVNLIGESTVGITVPEIIAKTEFKLTSVNATLASLKKKGTALQDGKLWFLPGNPNYQSGSGNSEHTSTDY